MSRLGGCNVGWRVDCSLGDIVMLRMSCLSQTERVPGEILERSGAARVLLKTQAMTTDHVEIQHSIAERVESVIQDALVALNEADPLVPSVTLWRGDDMTVERFMTGSYDDSIEQAMRRVNEADDATAYAVVWSGYIREGEQREAVIVETAELDSSNAVQLAQPYRFGADDRVVARGDLLAIGYTGNLLTHKLTTFDLESHLIKPTSVTTDTYLADMISQPFAQMPIALIGLAANLEPGSAGARVSLGLKRLQQAAVGETNVKLSQRVFTALSEVLTDGDLLNVLPSDQVPELIALVVRGVQQLATIVEHGQLWDQDANAYLAQVREIATEVLTQNGKVSMPVGSEKLLRLLDAVPTKEDRSVLAQ